VPSDTKWHWPTPLDAQQSNSYTAIFTGTLYQLTKTCCSHKRYARFPQLSVRHSQRYSKYSDLNNTTKKVVEYLPALTMCGNASRVSRYRRRHCANRNHAGKHETNGRTPYVTLPHTDGPRQNTFSS